MAKIRKASPQKKVSKLGAMKKFRFARQKFAGSHRHLAAARRVTLMSGNEQGECLATAVSEELFSLAKKYTDGVHRDEGESEGKEGRDREQTSSTTTHSSSPDIIIIATFPVSPCFGSRLPAIIVE